MTKLGNIYADFGPDTPDHARGGDLHVRVEVPRQALGGGAPFEVDIPLEIAGIARADPHGEGTRVPLNLPQGLPDGATLRLRGLGATRAPDDPRGVQRAGDLYVTVTLTDTPLPSPSATAPAPLGLIVIITVLLAAIITVVAILWR